MSMSTYSGEYLAPPTPGELATRQGLPLERLVKLDANESPWGPSPSARAALARLADMDGAGPGSIARYPDAASADLRAALAAYTGADASGIVIGNGSDEILQLLTQAFVGPGDEVIVSEPTFSVYALLGRRAGANAIDIGRDEEWRTTAESVVAAMTPRTRLVFLCAPNNPTGTPLDRATLDAALERAEQLAAREEVGPLIVVDEAYYEIGALAGDARTWTATPLLASAGSRLVVLRTFSKLFGLAGLRVGYGLCAPEVAEQLRALKAPYNVNVVGQGAAMAALSDIDWLRERAQRLITERERLARTLTNQFGLRVWPSAANFLLVEVAPAVAEPTTQQQRRDTFWQALLAEGVLTRRLAGPRLDGLLRVTIGLPEQNDAFCAALERARETLEGGPQWAK